MKSLVFGAVVLACAVPVFAQNAAPGQQNVARHQRPGRAASRPAPHARDNCRPVVVIPGVAGAVVQPAVPAYGSGIGSMERSGIGQMERSGIGQMERSGVGSIGAGGLGVLPAPSPATATPAPSVAANPWPAGSNVFYPSAGVAPPRGAAPCR